MWPFGGLLSHGGATPELYQAVGGTISSSEEGTAEVNSELLYDLDGGVRRRTETEVLTLFYSDKAPWSSKHPNETDGVNWFVRLDPISTSNLYDFGTSTHSLSTWYALDEDIMWAFKYFDTGPAFSTEDYSVRLSDDGGSTDYDQADLTINMTILA